MHGGVSRYAGTSSVVPALPFPRSKSPMVWIPLSVPHHHIIWFHPRHLSIKPNTHTRWWDIYPKEGGSNYTSINPTNLWPMFMQEQLASSLWVTFLSVPVLPTMIIMDIEKIHSDILSSLPPDPIASAQVDSLSPHWSIDSEGFLLFDEKIYVPDNSDLWLCIVQYKHDHLISSHFGQNWTMELVQQQYIWPKLHYSIKSDIKSCTTCMCSKSQRHHPYRLLKQLPIPKSPWNSISMDFIEKLPMSDGSDMILVIIDCLTKQLIFILTVNTITISNVSQTVRLPCLLHAWCPLTCNLWPGLGVHLHLLPFTWKGPGHETPFHLWLPFWGQWTDKTC